MSDPCPMIGCKVESQYHRITGEVIRWEPLATSMCDVLVRETSGPNAPRECWYASSSLRPMDGLGPLPSRAEVRETARVQAIADLEAIRAQHVANWHEPWPGMEHGKALVGKMIDGALDELKNSK